MGLELLLPYVRARVEAVMAELEAEGFDPVAFETRRSAERQEWLYGYGRTHHRGEKPRTWTRKSKHLVGKAVDIVSRSRWWDWPEFYAALKRAANAHGLRVIAAERCHLEWAG